MVKSIIKDTFFLSKKSIDATKEDKQIIIDLEDTLKHYKNSCVGMAANMIGYNKNIIAIQYNDYFQVLINPTIIKYFGFPFEKEEGCLSLSGQRKAKRYEKIKVEYLDKEFKKRITTYEGFIAQIIQHEIDHLNGIII